MSPQFTDPINTLFGYVRLLGASNGIIFLYVDDLEEKLRSGEPFDANEAQTWGDISRIVGQLDNETAKKALDELNRRYSATVASQARVTYHPFFQSGPRVEHLKLTAMDISGEATTQQNPLVFVSQQPVALDFDQLSDIAWSAPFLTFSLDERYWTVLLTGEKLLADVTDTYIFDAALLTRIYLGDKGYFLGRRSLIFYDDIHFLKTDQLPVSPAAKLIGFSSQAPNSEGLLPFFVKTGETPDGEIDLGPNPAITRENAQKLRENFVKLGLMLKSAGIVMDRTDWLQMQFNPESGKLIFHENARPFVFDADLLSAALDGNGWADKPDYLPEETVYIPDLRIYAQPDRIVAIPHEFLMGIIGMLDNIIEDRQGDQYRKSMETIIDLYIHHDEQENDLYTKFINTFSGGIFKIAQYYLNTIGDDGLSVFLNQIFAAVIMMTKGDYANVNINTDEWFDKAKRFIDEAKQEGGNFHSYWFRNYDRLWGIAEVVTLKRRGGGRGGPAPQNAPESGGEMEGGLSGGPTGLARPAESTVSGLLIPDETTGGAFASRQIVRAAENTFNYRHLRRQNPAINTIRSGQRVYQRPALPVALRPAQTLTFSP